jgi:hypothetical protein
MQYPEDDQSSSRYVDAFHLFLVVGSMHRRPYGGSGSLPLRHIFPEAFIHDVREGAKHRLNGTKILRVPNLVRFERGNSGKNGHRVVHLHDA